VPAGWPRPPLLGRHGLGLGAELPALQAREFEVDLLQLGVAPSDLAGLSLHLLLQACDQRSSLGGQLRDVDAGGGNFAEHGGHVASVRTRCASAYAMSTHRPG
jgi:hypothetical protein